MQHRISGEISALLVAILHGQSLMLAVVRAGSAIRCSSETFRRRAASKMRPSALEQERQVRACAPMSEDALQEFNSDIAVFEVDRIRRRNAQRLRT